MIEDKDLYLECLLLDTPKIEQILLAGKPIENISEINKASYEIFTNKYSKDPLFFKKIKEISQYIQLDLTKIENVKIFLKKYNKPMLIDKFKHLIIIFCIDDFIVLMNNIKWQESFYIREVKELSMILGHALITDEEKLGLKLSLLTKTEAQINYVIELFLLEQKIMEDAILKNKDKVGEFERGIKLKKMKLFSKLEQMEEKNVNGNIDIDNI